MGDIEPQASLVFISYSHRDKKWFDLLQVNLAPFLQKGALTVLADTGIHPGLEWKTEIESAMASASVAVLLVSPDFLASDFIRKNELPPLLQAAQAKGLTILWVAVSASLYEEAGFAKYRAVNDPSHPLDSLSKPKRDTELVEVARRIKEAVERVQVGLRIKEAVGNKILSEIQNLIEIGHGIDSVKDPYSAETYFTRALTFIESLDLPKDKEFIGTLVSSPGFTMSVLINENPHYGFAGLTLQARVGRTVGVLQGLKSHLISSGRE